MRLRFLLRPGWLATVLAVLVFAGACFWILSPWQFGRNAEREQQNAAITKALASDPVPLTSLRGDPAEREWRAVRTHGRFLPAKEVLARLRSVGGNPAYEVLTPFQPDNGKPLLVNRGYVEQDNGKPASYPQAPSAPVSIEARVHPDETGERAGETMRANGRTQVYAINSATVAKSTGLDLRTGSVTLTEGQPGVLGVIPLPQRESGPFLSYALQWIAFGVMALVGLGYFTWRELKPGGALSPERRAERRERKPHGRKAVAAAIAEDERAEQLAEHSSR